MPSRLRFAAIFTCLALVPLVCLRGTTADEGQQEKAECWIAELNNGIQQRFKDVDKNFGFSRIIPPERRAHKFKPEGLDETRAVGELEKLKVGVVLFLAGRVVLGPRPEKRTWERLAADLIKGPVPITPQGRKTDGLPAATELWDQSRRAFMEFRNSDSYFFSSGNWKFTARPVRAVDKSCLTCHTATGIDLLALLDESHPNKSVTPLKVGDPLGVIIYGYRSLR